MSCERRGKEAACGAYIDNAVLDKELDEVLIGAVEVVVGVPEEGNKERGGRDEEQGSDHVVEQAVEEAMLNGGDSLGRPVGEQQG